MSEISQNETSVADKANWINSLTRIVAYWLKLIIQTALAVVLVVGMAWLFGFAQRNLNWFNDAATSVSSTGNDEETLYACSMLCVFVKAPGRCPVWLGAVTEWTLKPVCFFDVDCVSLLPAVGLDRHTFAM